MLNVLESTFLFNCELARRSTTEYATLHLRPPKLLTNSPQLVVCLDSNHILPRSPRRCRVFMPKSTWKLATINCCQSVVHAVE